MIAGKSKATKVKSKSKMKSKGEPEFESKSEPCDKEDMSSEITNLVKKMMKRKNFTKRKVKENFKRRNNLRKRTSDISSATKKDITNQNVLN